MFPWGLTQDQVDAFSPVQDQHKLAVDIFRAFSQAFQPHSEYASLCFANGYFYEN